MTLISWNNGPILKGNGIGVESSCCCGGCTGANARCINIYRSAFRNDTVYCDITPPTDVYTVHVHVPECYTFPLTIRISGSVDDDLKVNGAVLEPYPAYPVGSLPCNNAHCVGSKNGYPYGYTMSVSSSPIELTLVDTAGQTRAMDITVCLDPDDEQACSECPTTTDEYADETLTWTGSAQLDACCVSPDCAINPSTGKPYDECRCVLPCPCDVPLPLAVQVTIEVQGPGGSSYTPLNCDQSEAAAVVNGTYILPLVEYLTTGLGSRIGIYRLQFEHGCELVVNLLCSPELIPDGLYSNFCAAVFGFSCCDLSSDGCYKLIGQRNQDIYFRHPAWSTLCELTPGQSYQYTRIDEYYFSAPFTCNFNVSEPYDYWELGITVDLLW